MELTIRDWMVVIGAGLILVVLVDAGRRLVRERRTAIRLNTKARFGGAIDDDDSFNLLAELPNGGARIVKSDDLSPQASAAIDDLGGDSGDADSTKSRESDDRSAVEALSYSSVSGEPAPEVMPSFSAIDKVGEPPHLSPAEHAESSPLVGSASEPNPATLDWLEQLTLPSEEVEPETRLPRGVEPHVFVLNVVSRSEQGFSGRNIMEILLACDLRFGDMDFFHRHEQVAGRGHIQFSVANMLKPGVFDIDNMAALSTRGLMFFITLPGPEDMPKAFDYMYETAKTVAKNLSGDVLDETQSAVTRQSLEHTRQQIRELERRIAMGQQY